MDMGIAQVAPSVERKVYLSCDGSAATAQDAIRLCGDALEKAGCVTGAFAQGCIDREADYPTGLCTQIPVALPHCKSDAILHSALCYLRLNEPVEFRRMDDDELTVSTRHVFNLAIAPGDHLEFLARTMQVLQDPAVLEDFEHMPIEDTAAYLEQRIGA